MTGYQYTPLKDRERIIANMELDDTRLANMPNSVRKVNVDVVYKGKAEPVLQGDPELKAREMSIRNKLKILEYGTKVLLILWIIAFVLLLTE